MSHIIQQPNITKVITERYDLKGTVSPRLDSTIVPVGVVSDDSLSQAPAVVRACTAVVPINAVVGEFPIFSMGMPGGTAAKILAIHPADNAGGSFILQASFNSLTSVTGAPPTQDAEFTDTRGLIGLGNLPWAQFIGGTAASLPLTNIGWQRSFGPALDVTWRPDHWLIADTQGRTTYALFQVASASNINFNVTFEWLEWSL